jgi:hypothetical protein
MVTTHAYSADDIRKLRDNLGIGMDQCKRAFDMAHDPSSGIDGDVIWAACSIEAGKLAISVKGDRAAWNVSRGSTMAESMRERWSYLNEVFPVRNTPMQFTDRLAPMR